MTIDPLIMIMIDVSGTRSECASVAVNTARHQSVRERERSQCVSLDPIRAYDSLSGERICMRVRARVWVTRYSMAVNSAE